jgi:hypothetical protein
MTECEQLKTGGIRSVQMGGPTGSMQPTAEGEAQIQDIWVTSCANNPDISPYPDYDAFRNDVIAQANGASADTAVEAVFQTAVTSNDTNTVPGATSFRPFLPVMFICIPVWWLKIYIWRTV